MIKVDSIWTYNDESEKNIKYKVLFVSSQKVLLQSSTSSCEFVWDVSRLESDFTEHKEPPYGYINYRVYVDASGVKRLLTCGTNHPNIVGYDHRIKINLETGEVVS